MSHAAARDAKPLLEDAARRADSNGDAAGAAFARALVAQMRMWTGEGSSEEAEEAALAALPLLEKEQDYAALADLWFALGNGAYNHRCRFDQMAEAAERSREYEALVGRPHHRTEALYAMALWLGSRPADEVLRRLDALDSYVWVDLARSIVIAMDGREQEARTLRSAAARRALELGASSEPESAEIDALYGDHEAAAKKFGAQCDEQLDAGITAGARLYAALEGRELCFLGRHEEGERGLARAGELGDSDDPMIQALWRQVAALAASRRGEHAAAERLAREAVAYLAETDSPKFQGDAFCDLAEVLEVGGRRDEAVGAWQEALHRYERKGVVPLARRVRERLAALQPA